jgi:hypothetical protein
VSWHHWSFFFHAAQSGDPINAVVVRSIPLRFKYTHYIMFLLAAAELWLDLLFLAAAKWHLSDGHIRC